MTEAGGTHGGVYVPEHDRIGNATGDHTADPTRNHTAGTKGGRSDHTSEPEVMP